MGRGGRFKREGACVYLWLIHDDVWQKPTQYCKVIILQLKIKTTAIATTAADKGNQARKTKALITGTKTKVNHSNTRKDVQGWGEPLEKYWWTSGEACHCDEAVCVCSLEPIKARLDSPWQKRDRWLHFKGVDSSHVLEKDSSGL